MFLLDAFGAFGHRVICLIEGECQTTRHPGCMPWSPQTVIQYTLLPLHTLASDAFLYQLTKCFPFDIPSQLMLPLWPQDF